MLVVFNLWLRGLVVSLPEDNLRVLAPSDLGVLLPVSAVNLWWLLALTHSLFLLWRRGWSSTSRWVELGLGLYWAWILWWILSRNAAAFRHGLHLPGVVSREAGVLVPTLVLSLFVVALVLTLIASARRYRHLMRFEGPRRALGAERRAGRERPWGGLERRLRRDWKDVYDFYLDEDTRARLAKMGALPKGLHLAFWLLKSMYVKLTPARESSS